MRSFLATLLLLAPAMSLHAATFVYVSKAPEKQIQSYRLDPKEGKLESVETFAVKGTPGSLTTSPDRKFLFASLRDISTLASYRIDPATGKLTAISTAALPKGQNAAFVATDRTGRWLISASYMGGTVVVHRIKEDGSIESPAVQSVKAAKTAHCVAVSPDNRFVYIPHVTPNAVFQYTFDARTGKLTDAGKAKGGTAKAGPRHLAFHPTLPLAFTSDESGSSITAYKSTDKGLELGETLSTLPEGFKAGNSTAEVKVHPSGKFVWVSNRGHESLAGFSIAEGTGKLTAIDRTPTEKTPRSFEIEPDGRYAFGAGEGSGKLAVFGVDASGKLSRLHTYPIGKSLTWVMAVRLKGE